MCPRILYPFTLFLSFLQPPIRKCFVRELRAVEMQLAEVAQRVEGGGEAHAQEQAAQQQAAQQAAQLAYTMLGCTQAVGDEEEAEVGITGDEESPAPCNLEPQVAAPDAYQP